MVYTKRSTQARWLASWTHTTYSGGLLLLSLETSNVTPKNIGTFQTKQENMHIWQPIYAVEHNVAKGSIPATISRQPRLLLENARGESSAPPRTLLSLQRFRTVAWNLCTWQECIRSPSTLWPKMMVFWQLNSLQGSLGIVGTVLVIVNWFQTVFSPWLSFKSTLLTWEVYQQTGDLTPLSTKSAHILSNSCHTFNQTINFQGCWISKRL